MKKILFLVALAVVIAACNPYGSEIPRKLAGNWINEKNGNFDYGFFEEFAIVNSKFWKYKSVNDSEIVLTDSIEEKTLTVNILTDSTITVNGENYFKIIYPDGVEKTRPLEVKKIADFYLSKMSYFPDVKEDTTDFAPYVFNCTDSATVIFYERNTAKGWQSFQRRFRYSNHSRCVSVVSRQDGELYGFWSQVIDSTEHYGERYVFSVVTDGVTQIDSEYLLANYGTRIFLPHFIEPNDTLAVSLSRETFDDIFGYRNECYVSGSNQRFFREQDLFFNYIVSQGVYEWCNVAWGDDSFDGFCKQYVRDSTMLENFIAQSKMPLSRKFVHYNKNVTLYKFAFEIAGYDVAEDFFKQNPQLFNEQEILLSPWGVRFIKRYFAKKGLGNIKKSGFSDEFLKLIYKINEEDM